MIKFFRKIRYELLEKKKTGKYLKYAIGEVILVVIGILIALQINNWNVNNNENARINSILNIVRADLIKDTLNIAIPINKYEERNALLLKIVEKEYSKYPLDSITNLNYKDHQLFTRAITNFYSFDMQDKGIGLLRSISTNLNFEKDTLITNIIEMHAHFSQFISEDKELMNKLQFKNEEEFEKQSWYIDWRFDKYNKEMFKYFYEDEYRRKAGRYHVYSTQFLGDLTRYKTKANLYIKLIEKRLEKI